MKKVKELLLGTSLFWLPILGCYIADIVTDILISFM